MVSPPPNPSSVSANLEPMIVSAPPKTALATSAGGMVMYWPACSCVIEMPVSV